MTFVLVVPSVTSSDSDVTAWISAVGSANITQTQANRVTTLVTNIKSHSNWTKLDRLWLHAAENTTQALTDVKAQQVATNHGATFVANAGYSGNGSSAWIDTHYRFLGAVNASQHSNSFGAYITNNRTVGDVGSIIQASDGSTYCALLALYSGTGLPSCWINISGLSATGITTTRNFQFCSRTASNACAFHVFNSGGQHTFTDAAADAALPNVDFYVHARNLNNVADSFGQDTSAAVMFGGGFTSAEAAFMSTDINGYMTALGINTY